MVVSSEKKEVLDLLNDALEKIKQADRKVKNERIIDSRVFYGTISASLESSIFHIERLKYWIEFEKEWKKRR